MNGATRKFLNLPLTVDPYVLPLIEWTDEDGQSAPEEQPHISDIIREETDHGRTVVRFLVSAMQGEIDDFQPCHRLDATRQLIKFGYDPAQSFLDSYMSIAGPAPADTAPPVAQAEPKQELHPDLAQVIAEETEGGRIAVRFLVQVMLGERSEFKPHHRINSAKELLRLGFFTHSQSQNELPPEKKGSSSFTLADGRVVTYDGHDIACDCYSGLTDCYGSPSTNIIEPRGIRGKAEREAFDTAFPDYVPPTDAEIRRIVHEYAVNKNPEATHLRDIPLHLLGDEARMLFDRDRREESGGNDIRSHRTFFGDNRPPQPP